MPDRMTADVTGMARNALEAARRARAAARQPILPALLACAALLCAGALAVHASVGALPAHAAAASLPAASLPAASLPASASSPSPAASPSASPTPAPTPQTLPLASSFHRARKWLAGRKGYTALAVVDSSGRLRGWHTDRQFISGSVTKAMLLVAYLRSHDSLTADERDVLARMIELSDNRAADVIYGHTGGDGGLHTVGHLAGMRDFVADRGFWGFAMISAADQARFFFGMDRLVPKQHRAFARHILSNLIPWQRYGLVRVARWKGWQSFTKGGWRSGLHGGRLIHQVSRLERDGATIAVAVLTDGQPSRKYARATIQGVALRLLAE
jgi:hypothetical protein